MSTSEPSPAHNSGASSVVYPGTEPDQAAGSNYPQDAFACRICEKVFSRRENLSRHLKTHDTPSHCCTICGKGFTRSDLLKRHEAGHERWDHETTKSKRRTAKRRKPNDQWTDENMSNSPNHISSRSIEVLDPGSVHSPVTSHNSGFKDNYQDIFAHSEIQQPQGMLSQTQDSVLGMQTNPNEYSNCQYEPADLSFAPFDFSSFLIPQDMTPLGHEWFSFDFYSAMRETGDEWGSLGHLDPSPASADTWSSVDPPSRQPMEESRNISTQALHHDGPVSRISSPPNEASEEDKWPFQWNPNSQQILTAQPISIPDNHPLSHSHDPRFDITETTLSKLESFFQPQFPEYPSAKRSFVLPALKLINIFIGLFFKHFSPQMPVLHHATINTNTDLPPPLLAAMIVIGAIYSHLKHTRRFAIILLDATRWHLQVAVECNNAFMRDAMIIYAEALIVHTGLWCGNKRAFELAEVGRGALVTYMRRAKFGEHLQAISTRTTTTTSTLDVAWRQWIEGESRKRLAWVIYTIDSQFPSLLNLPPTISIGEVRDLGCPCDEEHTPSRSFAAAVGPFVLGRDVVHDNGKAEKRREQMSVLSLNPWSAFLVLVTITHQIFQITQEEAISRTFDGEEECCSKEVEITGQGEGLTRSHLTRRACIADSLLTFASAYLSPHHPKRDPSIEYFTRSSHTLHKLSTILLAVPLPDLQNAIGKDGTAGIAQAISNLSSWARSSPNNAEQVAQRAVRAILSLSPPEIPVGQIDTAPYSLIAVFLCHVILWVFVRVSTPEQKLHLLQRLELDSELGRSSLISLLRSDLGIDEGDGKVHKKVLFRSGAEMLTRLGTWGASLNLALLLQRRAEM
ncbi:fungal-specific transcription factor domain-containing protein [Leptodontidium sp. 2 PMI_412]|nr:fungal-specific transcription factor domain-containing protein [Leptodontidium sp. 2 PMI_412]